jgi:hypothetical protein
MPLNEATPSRDTPSTAPPVTAALRISAPAGEPRRRKRAVMGAALVVLFIVMKGQAQVRKVLEVLVP